MIIRLSNGLGSDRRLVNTWTSDDTVYWRIHAWSWLCLLNSMNAMVGCPLWMTQYKDGCSASQIHTHVHIPISVFIHICLPLSIQSFSSIYVTIMLLVCLPYKMANMCEGRVILTLCESYDGEPWHHIGMVIWGLRNSHSKFCCDSYLNHNPWKTMCGSYWH